MIDRAGIRRIIEAHQCDDRQIALECHEMNETMRALVTENDKLATENTKLLDRIRKNES